MSTEKTNTRTIPINLPVNFPADWARKAWIDFWRTAAIFLAILVVTRCFVVQPFRIPSGSMIPTLLEGDFIVVKRYSYGLANPFTGKVLFFWNRPTRGDVMVFLKPGKESVYYIKRVIGVPGDKVELIGRKLIINGQKIECIASFDPFAVEDSQGHDLVGEKLSPTLTHRVRFRPESRDNTEHTVFDVPIGKYFVMGDNRDDSYDSRFWGFVPEENIQGQAAFIWLSLETVQNMGEMRPRWYRSGRIIR